MSPIPRPAAERGDLPPRRRRELAVALAGLALVAMSAGPAAAKTPGEVAIGQVLRDAPMQGLNGPSRNLSSFRGRPLIINVWASWCAPCRQEMASLERLAWQGHAARFAMIGISTDDDPARARHFLKASNATISHYIDRNLVLEHMLGASHLPLTVLVDADGRVQGKVYGAKQWDGAEALQLIGKAFGTRAAAAGR